MLSASSVRLHGPHYFALLRNVSGARQTVHLLEREVRALPLNYDERATGTSDRTSGVMDQRFGQLIHAGDHLTPEDWDDGFRTQTGQSVNVAANGIAKLLRMMIEEDD